MGRGDQQVIESAKQVARAILSGDVSPYEGGRRIWWDHQLNLESGNHSLNPFAYWASEYEEATNTDRRALCDKAIQNAATLLIERGSAL